MPTHIGTVNGILINKCNCKSIANGLQIQDFYVGVRKEVIREIKCERDGK